jgi:hypothetical protein
MANDTSAVLHSANKTNSEVKNELLPSGRRTLDAGSDALSSLGDDTRQVVDSTGHTLLRADAAIGVFGEDTARLQPILDSTAPVTANLANGNLVFATKARIVEKVTFVESPSQVPINGASSTGRSNTI